jgi:hypothetical protein
MVLNQVLVGMASGATIAFVGAAKNFSANGEGFSIEKFLDTIIVGALVGGIGGLIGVEQSAIEDYSLAIIGYGGAITVLRQASKVIRIQSKKLYSLIQARIKK